MKIVCNHFGDETFTRLANALKVSVQLHAPDIEFDEIVTDPPPTKPGLLRHYTDNHAKLMIWRAAVHAEPTGSRIVLMDADTLVLDDLDEAFDEDFDIGWTYRPGRLPMNGGVVYVRCNERSRAFMDAWCKRDSSLMEHRELANHGKRKFGGANQASFMWLLLHGGGQDICKMHGLPCRYWNSVDQTWCDFDDNTRVLHIKGRLRDACVGEPMDPAFAELKAMAVHGLESEHTIGELADLWREYDAAAEVLA